MKTGHLDESSPVNEHAAPTPSSVAHSSNTAEGGIGHALHGQCTAVAANIACEVGAVHLYNSHTTIEAKQETQLLHVASELD